MMNVELSRRVRNLSPSPTLAITAKANELKTAGHDVISLGAGEPDFNTPKHIIEAAYRAMIEGKTKYTSAGGISELKNAIIKKLYRDHKLTYSPSQIVVGSGAKQLLYNLFQVLINPGDEVIIPSPYWVSYPEQVKLAEGIPVFIEGREENQFKITADQVEKAITDRTKAIVINSPSNPTGAVYQYDELKRIAQVAVEHQLWIISDEIYEKLIYEGTHVSIAALNEQAYEHTILINGHSKPYAMTGWRIGYAAGNAKVIEAMTDLSSQSISNPTTFSQYGAIAALEEEQSFLDEMRSSFKARRDHIFPLINQIPGFSVSLPQGAFYFYINIREAMNNSGYHNVDEWSNALLEKEKVAVVPGTGFGTSDHIRISYATALNDLVEALERMNRFVQREKE